MKIQTKVIWLGYASVFLSIVWGVGLVPALMARHLDRHASFGNGHDPAVLRDLKGGRFLYRAGFVLNGIVIVMICWIFISTWLF